MAKRCWEHLSGGSTVIYGGELPCAWPECQNGTSQERIVQDRGHNQFGQDLGRVAWQRSNLASFDGRRRFFWRDDRRGWWSAGMELSEYESTQVLRPLATTKHVYHYTSVSAFQQIVETQELWLTDYPYLNDATEIRHGLAIAMRVFEETLRTFSGDTKRMLLRLLSLSADQQPRVCVGCFSLERDSLTQWKGYGRGSLGVAFGVDPPIFAEGIRNGGFMRLAPIVYSDSSKEYLIRSFVHDWASLFELDCRDTLEQDFSPYEHLPKIKFYDLLAMFKDYAFHDEREYRFIYQEGDTERRFFKAPKRFRVAGPLLVPFTTTDGLGGPEKREPPKRSRLEIAEVLIGPHPHGELAAAGLREFLQSHGYGHVPVVVSLVPYR